MSPTEIEKELRSLNDALFMGNHAGQVVLAAADICTHHVASMREATHLATCIWSSEFRDESPNWRPLDTVEGIISQIDNMYAGVRGQRDEWMKLFGECTADFSKAIQHRQKVEDEREELRAKVAKYESALGVGGRSYAELTAKVAALEQTLIETINQRTELLVKVGVKVGELAGKLASAERREQDQITLRKVNLEQNAALSAENEKLKSELILGKILSSPEAVELKIDNRALRDALIEIRDNAQRFSGWWSYEHARIALMKEGK